jgi:hypothetical protein
MPTDVDAREVDKGWIARFFSAAADVSESDMQKLWGKLLAGETATPGRFNTRALETLKNLSSTEAALFSKACTFVTGLNEFIIKIPDAKKNNFILTYDTKALADLGFRFEDVLKLVDAGLILPGSLSWELPASESPPRLMNNGRFFTLKLDADVASGVGAKIGFDIYKFTSAGIGSK